MGDPVVGAKSVPADQVKIPAPTLKLKPSVEAQPTPLSKGDEVRLGTAKNGKAPVPPIVGVDWRRLGIAAGMAPVAYVAGVTWHEFIGHGLVVKALGGDITGVKLLPHTYTQPNGATGVRFGAVQYQPGADWNEGHFLAVHLGPAALDTAILGTGAVLYETDHWPQNPWASGALYATQVAAAVDLGVNAMAAISKPEGSSDTAKAARVMGIQPQLLGGIEMGLAIASGINLVRIGVDVFSRKGEATPTEKSSDVTLGVGFAGTNVMLQGTF